MDENMKFASKTKLNHVIYAVFLLGSAVTVFLIFLAPVLAYLRYTLLSDLVYHAFSASCHQLEDRSLHFLGFKLAVCARCTGIYLGFLISTLAYGALKRIGNTKMPPYWTLILAIPIALDGATQLFGQRESTNTLRLLTGLLFGIAVPFYVIPLINIIMKKIISTIE